MLKSLPRIARQWSSVKIAILSLKPRNHIRILIYRTWANVVPESGKFLLVESGLQGLEISTTWNPESKTNLRFMAIII